MGNASKIVEDIQELTRRACERIQRGSQIPPRLLDIDDSARYLGMSDKGIRELIQVGELPYVQKIAGRSPYLIDIKDLDTWVAKNKIRASE
jgi:excisionase family DNA binding protein